MLAGLQLFLARTATGRAMRATSDDPETAALMGLDDRARLRRGHGDRAGAPWRSPGSSSACAAPSTPPLGPQLLIFAFEAVIIGGLGSLWGTLLGGLVLGRRPGASGPQIDPAYGVLAGHLVFLRRAGRPAAAACCPRR